MNIFFLSQSPKQAAKYYVDKHYKIVLEIAQMMSTAVRLKTEVDGIYRITHKNHPTSIWLRNSFENFYWAYDHAHYLVEEFTRRGFKKHKSLEVIRVCSKFVEFENYDLTPPFLSITPGRQSVDWEDAVSSYRKYYMEYKSVDKNGKSMLKWTNAKKPEWFKN